MIKITTLVDNVVYKKGCKAEHGLSYLIETAEATYLFDTGQTRQFFDNATVLNKALNNLQAIILSHGHYDHAGGLPVILDNCPDAVVWAHPRVFDAKYSKNGYIGLDKKVFAQKDRFRFPDTVQESGPGIYIVSEIPIVNEWDTHFDGFFIKEGSEKIRDEFEDELYMVIVSNDKINVITGCAHRGITNILSSAVNIFKKPIGHVMGGFHLKNASEETMKKTAQKVSSFKPEHISIGHCTGLAALEFFNNWTEAKVSYNSVGEITLL